MGFHYVYAVLHHPEYRQRYAANLRRELPRIPFVSASDTTHDVVIPSGADGLRSNPSVESRNPASAGTEKRHIEAFSPEVHGKNSSKRRSTVQANQGSFDSGERLASLSYAQDDTVRDDTVRDDETVRDDVQRGKLVNDADVFRAFVAAGQRLAEIHVNYEQRAEYPLTKTEKLGEKLDWRVTKMRLGKDKTTLIYNDLITLSGIPPDTYEYRLGNRSALERVIDQYKVSTDKRSGITNDPTVPTIRNISCDSSGK